MHKNRKLKQIKFPRHRIRLEAVAKRLRILTRPHCLSGRNHRYEIFVLERKTKKKKPRCLLAQASTEEANPADNRSSQILTSTYICSKLVLSKTDFPPASKSRTDDLSRTAIEVSVTKFLSKWYTCHIREHRNPQRCVQREHANRVYRRCLNSRVIQLKVLRQAAVTCLSLSWYGNRETKKAKKWQEETFAALTLGLDGR